MQTDIYTEMATRIVAEQEKIIGPVAYSQAGAIKGLVVNRKAHTVTVAGNGPETIDSLVESYKALFGNAAVDVCKEAVGKLKYSIDDPAAMPHLLQ